jgi:hypothetical protein
MLLHLAVPVPECHRRARLGAYRRELDDPAHARRHGGVDGTGLPADPSRVIGTGQEERVGAVERGAHGPRVRQVAGGQLDVLAELVPGLFAIAHEGAYARAPLG